MRARFYTKAFLWICVLLLHFQWSSAQFGSGISPSESQVVSQDSLSEKDSVIVKNAFFKIFTGKPGKAALYSLILPGAGQLYNRKYWKAPIAWGIDGFLIYNIIYQTTEYNFYNKTYLNALATGDINVLFYKVNRDKFRRSKEFGWLYLIAGHLLTTMDAYVDRHLMEFDISPDLSVFMLNNSPVYCLGVQIPLYSRRK